MNKYPNYLEVTDGKNKWKIELRENKELVFAYAIPRHLSTWKSNPLWRNWRTLSDLSDLEDEWSYDFEKVNHITSIFRAKTLLLNGIVDLIGRSTTEFFYFVPTSKQRGRIYSNLTNTLLRRLGDGWTHQIVDDWFYFTKFNSHDLH